VVALHTLTSIFDGLPGSGESCGNSAVVSGRSFWYRSARFNPVAQVRGSMRLRFPL